MKVTKKVCPICGSVFYTPNETDKYCYSCENSGWASNEKQSEKHVSDLNKDVFAIIVLYSACCLSNSYTLSLLAPEVQEFVRKVLGDDAQVSDLRYKDIQEHIAPLFQIVHDKISDENEPDYTALGEAITHLKDILQKNNADNF